MHALITKMKIGFIDGTIETSQDANSEHCYLGFLTSFVKELSSKKLVWRETCFPANFGRL